MPVTQLALTWVGWPNGENLHWLSGKFDLDQSERKSTQVNARPGQTESQVDPSFQLAFVTKSPGQTDSQVVASSCKLKLRRDLRWVDKRTGKFPHKYTQVANKPISRQTFLIFHWLMIGQWTSLNCVDLAWVAKRWKTFFFWLACKFDLASRPKFSTCVYLRLRLARALSPLVKRTRKLNLRPLATTCRSVWPGLNNFLNPKLSFPLRKLHVQTILTLFFTPIRWPVILKRRPEAKRRN